MSAPPTRALLAAYALPEPLKRAVSAVREAGGEPLDAFTPFPVEGLAEALAIKPHRVRTTMALGGLCVAAGLYALEWWSATVGYPFNTGGRPLHSWPAFLIAPVELGILAAALSGFVAVLVKTGLPRLHHPLFDREPFERASQDQFLLAVRLPGDAQTAGRARQALFDAGAVWIEETDL